MYIHWKSLFGFAFIFWLLLCLNELLGGGKTYKYLHLNDFDEIYDKKFVENLVVQKAKTTTEHFQHRGIKLGLSLLMWNTIAFAFSLIFCSLASSVSWILWKVRICHKTGYQTLASGPASGNLTERSNSAIISKIPVMIKSNSTMARSSDTNIKTRQAVAPEDSTCLNLLPLKRSRSSISQSTVTKNCQTLFRNSNVFSSRNSRLEKHLENQCSKLREEMIKMQAHSLKEHAALSRKLDAVNKEKRELFRQLTVAQKENRAAKQQLDELLQEKSTLMKRLDNATKEFKCNTKAKKFALAKLEEATSAVEDLKQQLEQVTRDKEILENKLRVLESEYEKLQERLIFNQNHDTFDGFHEHTPERDVDTGKDRESQAQKGGGGGCQYNDVECNTNKNSPNISTVSQTELDMKKIELKIKQLERNLENFNATKSELNFRAADREESELSVSGKSNRTDSRTQLRTDDEADVSENPFISNPRFRYWGGRAGDMVGRKDQFTKIQAIATRMHERGRFLENIKEGCESTKDTDPEDFSSPESVEDIREPKRIVSSSAAFQNFLRSLHSSEYMRRQYGSQCDLYF